MARRTEAQADRFDQALVAALADLLDCEPEKVELRVDAPGLDDLRGSVRLDLTIGADEGADDQRAEDSEAEAAAPEAREGDDDGGPEDDAITPEELDEEADAAADFLEGLLDALDLPGDLRIKVSEDHADVELVDIGTGALIGRRGQTLEAIQELVRCALQREFQRRSRVKVDIEGYRARRLEKLLEKAQEAIDDVLDTGESQRLEPMDVFERKAVHQLVAEHEGVASRSQGREPGRRVVIEPA